METDVNIVIVLTISCADPGIIYSYLPIEIAIGFSTGSRSLKSDEANGTVTVKVNKVKNCYIVLASAATVDVTDMSH